MLFVWRRQVSDCGNESGWRRERQSVEASPLKPLKKLRIDLPTVFRRLKIDSADKEDRLDRQRLTVMTVITPVSPHLHYNPITSPGLEKVKVNRIHRHTVDTFVERLQQLQLSFLKARKQIDK